MLETNPFSVFCPPNAKYFILGSFVAKDGKEGVNYDWYYSNGRNQFWRILEDIYKTELKGKEAQQDLFAKLAIAVADIILQCERIGSSSLDTHLTNFVYNIPAISEVLQRNAIEKILFTSKFVEAHYKRYFKSLIEEYPNIELVTLPSPSPRYASMSKEEKIRKYSQVFPKL
ncbi:MAG: hypothetical protein ACD_22C00047G0020 [uncultured bacterium]|nr:MAG: hypothetical protein ACD_22C00047G0020 [uncultured bacterium]